MKMTIFVALSLAVFGVSAHAQTQAPDAHMAPPPGSLIVPQMPDHAQWRVDFTYTNTAKPGQPSVLDQAKKAALSDPSLAKALNDPQYVFMIQNFRPLHILTTKTDSVRHEERAFEQGLEAEMWKIGDITVERKPNLPQLVVGSTEGLEANEFPEFAWISRSNFSGLQAYSGHKCMTFKEDRYIDHVFAGTAYAWVDLATHYPVAYQYTVETRNYTVLSPPIADLDVPDEFAAAAKAMKTRVQKATPHLAPP